MARKSGGSSSKRVPRKPNKAKSYHQDAPPPSSNGSRPWMISSAAVAFAAVYAAGYMSGNASRNIAANTIDANIIKGGGNVDVDVSVIEENVAATMMPTMDYPIDQTAAAAANNRSLRSSDEEESAAIVDAEANAAPSAPPAAVKAINTQAASSSSATATSSLSFGSPKTPETKKTPEKKKKTPPSPPSASFAGSEASIAAYHSLAVPSSEQRENLLRYLLFDDGYSACLTEKSLPTYRHDPYGVRRLKRAKWTLINEWATDEGRWVASLPSDPSTANVEETTDLIEGTCRLLTLNHDDYGGRAAEVLWGAIDAGDAGTFRLDNGVQSASSDYRTVACLSRFVDATSSSSEFPPRNKDEEYARNVLLNAWATAAAGARERAELELTRETQLPFGWKEQRDESGYSFYMNPVTKKTTWIRPVVKEGDRGRTHTPPGPHETSGKVRHASLTVRVKPCKVDEGMLNFTDHLD